MACHPRHWLAPTVAFLLLLPGAADAARRTRAARTARPAYVQRAPRSEEERALYAIQQEGDLRIKALLHATKGWTDKAMLSARAHRIGELRQDTRRRQLEVRAAFARRRGDHAEAAALEKTMARGTRASRRGA
jgi:hypothetical protein